LSYYFNNVYYFKQSERERLAAEKKSAKLEKLRKFVTEGESKHEFFDPKYDTEREAATDRVHEAVQQVTIVTNWTRNQITFNFNFYKNLSRHLCFFVFMLPFSDLNF